MNQFRWTSLIPLVAMAALAGITWWLLQATLPRQNEGVVRPKEHTPDYFADNFSVSELDQSGSTQYRLTAQSLIHYEDDDVIETEKPVKLQRGMSVMTASGMNYNNVTRVMQLFGNVKGNIAPSEAG